MFNEDESPKPEPESLRHSWRKRLEKFKPSIEAASEPVPAPESSTTEPESVPELAAPMEKSSLGVRRRLLATPTAEEATPKEEPESSSRFGRWRANLRYAMGQGPETTEPNEELTSNTIGKWRQKIQSVQPAVVEPEIPDDSSSAPGSWRDRLRFVKPIEEDLPVAPDTGPAPEILVVSAPVPDLPVETGKSGASDPFEHGETLSGTYPVVSGILPSSIGLAAEVPFFPATEPTYPAFGETSEVLTAPIELPDAVAELIQPTSGPILPIGGLAAPLVPSASNWVQESQIAQPEESPSPVADGLFRFFVQAVPETETGNDLSPLPPELPKAQPIGKEQIRVRPEPTGPSEVAQPVPISDLQAETGLVRPLPPPPPPALPTLKTAAGRLPRPTGVPVAPRPVQALELPEPETKAAAPEPKLESVNGPAFESQDLPNADPSKPSSLGPALAPPTRVAGFALSLPLELPVEPPPPPPAPPKMPPSVVPAFKPLDDAAPGLVRPALRPSKSPTAPSLAASKPTKQRPKYYKVDSQELSVFTRQLSTMIQSGITIHAALSFFGESGQPGQLTTVVGEIANKVCTGSRLSEGFRAFPEVFSPVYVGLVETAEASSRLDETLARLADLLENQNRLRQRLVSAITYPAFLLVASTAAIALFVYYILPMMGSLYQGLGIVLPWPTRLLLQMRTVLPLVVGVLTVASVGYWLSYQRLQAWLRKNTPVRRKLHRILLHLPALGTMIEKMSISRVLYSFSTMLDAGLSFNESLRRCSAVAGNQIISDRLDQSRVDLVDGHTIQECFSRNDVFPRACIQMLAVGEESASMNLMITYAAKYYESEVDCAIERFTALIEPTIMAGMGIFVGFIVLSAVLPTVRLIEAL
jgi:type IV pilus assembly protein PilC